MHEGVRMCKRVFGCVLMLLHRIESVRASVPTIFGIPCLGEVRLVRGSSRFVHVHASREHAAS